MLFSTTKPGGARGLTIIEAIVTMAILGAGIASVASATAFIAERVRRNHARFLAGSLAELVMEEIRSFGCDPNLAASACDRLVTQFNPTEDSPFPRLYCWPPKGEPTALTGNNPSCDPGHLFRVDALITLPETLPDAFRRARLTAGVLPTSTSSSSSTNINLQNIANVRVTVRWGDVRLDNGFDAARRPQFVVYQTRITQ